jgi:hypothetical protein
LLDPPLTEILLLLNEVINTERNTAAVVLLTPAIRNRIPATGTFIELQSGFTSSFAKLREALLLLHSVPKFLFILNSLHSLVF